MSGQRIAFYMHDLSGGGVERMRLSLIAQLRARGLDVRLVLAKREGPLVSLLPTDLPVEQLGQRHTLTAVLPLARFLRRTHPDVLVASLDHNNVTAILARMVARVPTRVVICQHNALSSERALGWRYRVVPWLYRLLQRGAHGIVAVSHGVADDLSAATGIPRGRITPIYNPVIGPDFADRVKSPAPHPWLARDRSCPVFVFAGRLTEQKDPATLLSAMGLLSQSRAARLIVLGEGPLRHELAAQAAKLGITDRIVLPGFQSNPLPWIAHADAVVSTSRYEGLGNVIIEALACGTPVIATDCPHGPSEILLAGKAGRLVPVGDAAALAQAMHAQLDVAADALALRTRAADFTAEACANAHQALFSTLLSGRNRVQAFGLGFSDLRADQVVARLTSETVTEGVRLIVTPNLDHVRLLRRSDFAAAYKSAYLVCPDGFPVLLYARLRGLALRSRVTGCELFHSLANHADLPKQRLCVVVETACTAAAVSAWSARLGLASHTRVLLAASNLTADGGEQTRLTAEITAFRPSILVMTLGAPASELFVYHQRYALPPCWALCVGQAVRVELGLTRRAPLVWRRLGLEWLWRLRQEPRRLAGRYVKSLAWFPMAVLRDMKS